MLVIFAGAIKLVSSSPRALPPSFSDPSNIDDNSPPCLNAGYLANILMMAGPTSVADSKDRATAAQVMVIFTVVGLTAGSLVGVLLASIL